MVTAWQRMGISKEAFDELSYKLAHTMKKSAEKTSRLTHADEDSFFSKFLGRLGEIEFGNGFYLDFQDSKTTSKGVGSAEKKYGSDFGLRVDFNKDNGTGYSKAIIGQAKNFPRNHSGHNKRECRRLAHQCSAMADVTSHYIVTFRPTEDGSIPFVYLGDVSTKLYSVPGIRFDYYLLNYVLPCVHGETNKQIIDYMVSATHEGWKDYLRIFTIQTNLPAPDPTLDYTPRIPHR
ncbi:TPA: hypothetical protein ACXNQR_002918 [Enterobacter kobei]